MTARRTARLAASFGFLVVLVIASGAAAQPYAFVLGYPGTTGDPQKLTVINTATNAIVKVLTVGGGCDCVGHDKIAALPDGSRVYAVNEIGNSVTVVDTASLTILTTITTNINNPTAAVTSLDGSKLYVVNVAGGNSNLAIYDTVTNGFLSSIPFGPSTFPRGITLNPAGTKLYVSMYSGNVVKVIDTATQTITATITGGAAGAWMTSLDVSPDGTKLYVVNVSGNSLSVYSTATNAYSGITLATGSAADGVRFGKDGTRAYATYQNGLRVINAQTDGNIQTTGMGNFPRGLDVTPDGTRLYIANNPGKVQVVSTATNAIVGTITLTEGVNGRPGSVAIVGAAVVSPVVDLNGDALGDAFIYSPTTGAWAIENTVAAGGFTGINGAWAPGWSVTRARFNTDALTDLFLFNNTSGQWFKMVNDGLGNFTVEGFAAWGPNWQRFVVDLNGDGLSDLFLWDPTLGTWFKCIATAGGFTYTQGFWSLGWEVYPMRLNADAYQDFFIFNRGSGQWFWVAGEAGPGFTFPQFAAWSTVWQFHPGDFNGDDLGDLLLHNPANGQVFVALNTAGNFGYTFGTFTVGFAPIAMDIDANGRADLLLHNASTGQWFEMLSTGTGTFTAGGNASFAGGFNLYATDFNADGRGDLLLYNPTNGQWFQARNLTTGSFTFSNGVWITGLDIVTGAMR